MVNMPHTYNELCLLGRPGVLWEKMQTQAGAVSRHVCLANRVYLRFKHETKRV